MSTDTQKPVAWMTHHDEPMLFPTDEEARSYCDDDEQPIPLYAAPVAAQPEVTQQTLDDVMAGIPARDAEIEALRKEIEALHSQHATTLANIEAFVACDASAISYLSLGEYRTALLKMLRQTTATKEPGA